jgi:hypothetical protein
MPSAVVAGFMAPFEGVRFGGIIPVHRIVGISGPVPCNLPADAGMVSPQAAADLRKEKSAIFKCPVR